LRRKVSTADMVTRCSLTTAVSTTCRRAARKAREKSGSASQRYKVASLTPAFRAASAWVGSLNRAAIKASCRRGNFAP
jgi:hypothetical protein